MSVNKVTAFGENLIDLTEDTVTKDTLIKGVTAHDASGNSVTGDFDTDKYLEKTGDASNTTAVFSASKERANISTGEKLSVIFGKIAKFFSDLKTVAFTGNYSDLSGTPSVVSKTADGLCPKNGGTTTKFLRDDGTYAVPTSSVIGLSTLEQVTAAATAGNVTAPVGAGALAEVNSSLADGKIKFGIDADGNYGYIKDGADSVTPFNSDFKILVNKSGSSITKAETVSGYSEYIVVSFGATARVTGLTVNNGIKETLHTGFAVYGFTVVVDKITPASVDSEIILTYSGYIEGCFIIGR